LSDEIALIARYARTGRQVKDVRVASISNGDSKATRAWVLVNAMQ
jgi:hypothetical protein